MIKRLSHLNKLLFIIKSKLFKNKKPFVYVALGDSTIEGMGATIPERNFASLIHASLKQSIKNTQYHNLGKAGARVEDVIKKQLEKTIQLNPDLIVLSIGANDLTQRTNLKKFEAEYKELLHKLAKTNALLVVNNIPDITLAPAIPRVTIPYFLVQQRRFNNIIKNISKEFGSVLVDLNTQSKLFKGYKELVSSDGFHPSDAGYALWANTIINKIQPLITKI